MKIHKTRGAVAVAMLVGLSVLAGCGDSKDEAVDAPPVVTPVVTPSATSTPSTTPSTSPTGSPTPSGSASADSDDPEFLATSDLPTGSRYGTWKANGIEEGLPDPEYFCMEDVLPADETEYQQYSSDLEAEVRQFFAETDSEADAKALVAKLDAAITDCVDAYKKANPNDAVTGKEYPDQDGAQLFGRFFAPKDSEYTQQLFAIGSKGSTVTVVVLGQGGKEDEAPLSAFKSMVSAAMGKL